MSQEVLPEHVRWLLAENEGAELEQTHVSFVVLRESDVLKLKKPVHFDFVDLRSLDSRRIACKSEVALNSRLCPDLYLGVVSIARTSAGYELNGRGEVVDYAVHMKRLSDEGMLDRMLKEQRAGISTMGEIAGRLANFHETAATSEDIAEVGGYERLVANWEENFAAVAAIDREVLPPATLEQIHTFVSGELQRLKGRLLRRQREGHVRDGHGDLRADAVWIDPGNSGNICIFDCLEFNERYRFSDTGLDAAFLAMDLDARGHRVLSDLFVGLYCQASGEGELPILLSFFKCYRAFVRGKVRFLAAQDPAIPPEARDEATEEARHQFALALSYCVRPTSAACLIVVCGLTGSGKSVLAGTLAARLGAALLSTDVTRKALAGLPPTSSMAAGFQQDLYSPAFTEQAYRHLLQRADDFLQVGMPAVLDGTFSRRSQRTAATALAARQRLPILFLECQAPEEVIRDRQSSRASDSWKASDATWETYLRQRSEAEPIDEGEGRHIVIGTMEPIEDQLEAAQHAIRQLGLAF